ncbi:MAG: AAA family ATPase [Floccifex porci]|nr:AAA family ATPase [Floccifex porci]
MEKLQNERGISADQIVFMRFDSMEYEDMTAKQMFEAVKLKLSENKKTYFILDEVQEIEG